MAESKRAQEIWFIELFQFGMFSSAMYYHNRTWIWFVNNGLISVSTRRKMGFVHHFHRPNFHIYQISCNAHICRCLRWIYNNNGRTNAYGWYVNTYHFSSCIWRRKGSVSRNKRMHYSGSWFKFHKFINKYRTNASLEVNREAIRNDSISFGITVGLCALVQLLSGIVCIDCFNHTAIRQISRIRIKYFQSFIRQEIGWYDVASGNNNFAVRVTE